MFKHILLATDGSTASSHAAQMAVGLARAHGAQLSAVYVVDPYPYLGIGESNPAGFQAYIAAARQMSEQAIEAVVELGRAAEPAVEVKTILIEDKKAWQGIVDVAQQENADLIVVGSHGRGGLERLVMGSVATKVVSHSAIPVLVVR